MSSKVFPKITRVIPVSEASLCYNDGKSFFVDRSSRVFTFICDDNFPRPLGCFSPTAHSAERPLLKTIFTPV